MHEHDDHAEHADHADHAEHADHADEAPATTEPDGAAAPDHEPSPEAVEEFERLAVLRMGGQDIEGALEELPEEDAREVAEIAIDRVVRGYDHL
ncbi:hypothetical protein ACMA46_05730 [Clavibacter sp. Sh2141]|uniref:hypothetical protein n=1 Tax=Clavibacter sp. Sh2141 TaxID=3395374 RepID=UPI0039BC77ED